MPKLRSCSFCWIAILASVIAPACGIAQQATTAQQTTPAVPDWAIPGSATHKQVPPPPGFHRPTHTENTSTGIFTGVSEIGGPLVTGSSSFDPKTGTYTIRSAGYNIWYGRDEFRFLWKKMSGNVSFAADVAFPEAGPPSDRKAVLVIRQSLEDDSAEAVAAEHGTGMVHVAQRPSAGANMTDLEYRFGGVLSKVMAQRIGLEKRGDSITLYASLQGEPMHPLGPPIQLHFDGPFYVGIGFSPTWPRRSTRGLSRRSCWKTPPARCADVDYLLISCHPTAQRRDLLFRPAQQLRRARHRCRSLQFTAGWQGQ